MRVGVLGPLLVLDDAGHEIPVTAGRIKVLLATLVVRANQTVSVDELAEMLWDGAPPPGAARTVRRYVVRLRRALGSRLGARIGTRAPGYVCDAGEDELDLLRFENLCRHATASAHELDWARTAELLAEALGLWRGAPLVDIPSELLHERELPRLEQARVQALEWRIEAELHVGRGDQVIPELRDLTGRHPLRERFHAQLMRALAGAGRQAEALAAYRDARRVLVDQLGIEPGVELQDLHQRILAGDADLLAPPGSESTFPQASSAAGGMVVTYEMAGIGKPVPRQLPAPVAGFVGRQDVLDQLSMLLDRPGGTGIVTAIGGTAGVGKTAVAVHWAYRVAERFPDGQLYVNLRGYDADDPMPAEEALARFLRTLGMAGPDIPAELDERAAAYRSLIAGRRMLIVLDNAGWVEQVRPLLPGGSTCVAVVTSRNSLAGLVARDGARRVELGLLPLDDAVALLRGLVGVRVDDDTDAAATLAIRCCRLPLALRVAAELAVFRPDVPLDVLAEGLADERHRLDALDVAGDTGTAVRAVFSWSYRYLDFDAARAFRLIGLHPGADIDGFAVAALAGTTYRRASLTLDQLSRAHLVQSVGRGRFGMHDLLRAYARELADNQDAEERRRLALTDLFDYYLHSASAALDALFPAETTRRPRVVSAAAAAVPLADQTAARAWLDAERANLIAVAAYAADNGWPGHAMALSATVYRYLDFGSHIAEAITLHGHALRAARLVGDTAAEAGALSQLGFAEFCRCRYSPAADYQRQALTLWRKAGNPRGEAHALHRLTLVERRLGELDQAIRHGEQVLTLSRESGDRLAQSRALISLGAARRLQGRFREAAEYLRQALALLEEIGDGNAPSVVHKELGIIELRFDRLDTATDHFTRALALCRETGNRDGETEAISQLGLVRLHRGDYQQAADDQRQALARFRELADRSGECEVLARLAAADLKAGRGGQAVEHFEQALNLSRRLGAHVLETAVLNGLGAALLANGQPDLALVCHTDALRLARHAGMRYEQARAYHGVGDALTGLGDTDGANREWRQALDGYTELGIPEAEQLRSRLTAAALADPDPR